MCPKDSDAEFLLFPSIKQSSPQPEGTFIKFLVVLEKKKPSLHELHMQIKNKMEKEKKEAEEVEAAETKKI